MESLRAALSDQEAVDLFSVPSLLSPFSRHPSTLLFSPHPTRAHVPSPLPSPSRFSAFPQDALSKCPVAALEWMWSLDPDECQATLELDGDDVAENGVRLPPCPFHP